MEFVEPGHRTAPRTPGLLSLGFDGGWQLGIHPGAGLCHEVSAVGEGASLVLHLHPQPGEDMGEKRWVRL